MGKSMGRFPARNPKTYRLLALPVIALLAIAALAQQPATPSPTLPVYDIVSIHPHNAPDDNVGFGTRPGSFTASNASLKGLISYAYGIRDDLISGLPHWADTARFDVTAKASEFDPSTFQKLTREQREAMLQPILMDRFHVKAHTEIKTLEVFNLVVTKDGPKFKPSPPPDTNPNHPPPPAQLTRGGVWINNYDMVATGVPISTLAEVLAQQLHHTVIDKTGLTGDFDLKLKWTPDNLLNKDADDGSDSAAPGLFTALQEQLGLKLDPAKGPVETLVVDHAEQPTPN